MYNIKKSRAKKQEMKGIKCSTRSISAVKHSVMIPARVREQASRNFIEDY
jgi:hypothetical protein